MIPKIAHFHWVGDPMPWLRMVGIYTFARLNPDWEIQILRTPEHIKRRKLPLYCQEADWTWLDAVWSEGGFAMATDTVFVRPVPEEWLDADFCCAPFQKERLLHCCYGSIPTLSYLDECLNACELMKGTPSHQDMGIVLMNNILDKKFRGLSKLKDRIKVVEMSENAMTPVGWFEPEKCWDLKNELEIPDDTIGVTWFGGHESSRKHSPTATSKDDYAIVKLARQVLEGAY